MDIVYYVNNNIARKHLSLRITHASVILMKRKIGLVMELKELEADHPRQNDISSNGVINCVWFELKFWSA